MKNLIIIANLFITVTFTQAQVKEHVKEHVKYTIMNQKGSFLDITGGSKDNGANVQLWNKNGSTAQQFTFVKAGGGWWYIKNVNSGKVLDIAGGKDSCLTNIQQYEANFSPAQKFRVVDAGYGYVHIKTWTQWLLNSETIHGKPGSNVFLFGGLEMAKWRIEEVK